MKIMTYNVQHCINYLEQKIDYELIAKIEAEHEKIFTAMAKHLENGTLYKREQPIKWKCENCGFEYSSENALEACPVCGKPIGYMRGDL